MRRSIFILCLVSLALFGKVTETFHSANLRVTAQDEELASNLRTFALSCSKLVDNVLGFDDRPSRSLTITVGTKSGVSRFGRRATVSLNESSRITDTTYWVLRGLLNRRCNELFPPEPPEAFISFLASALTFRRLTQMRLPPVLSAGLDYGAARTLFAGGQFPDLETLYRNPMPLDHPVFFRLHAMHCELFLKCLENTGDDSKRILKALCMAKSETPLAETLAPFLPKEERLQAWYEQNVFDISRYSGHRLQERDITERLDELLVVPVIDPNEKDGIHTIRLEELPEAMAQKRIDKAMLERIRFDILNLCNDAPMTIHPGIQAVADAVSSLISGSTRLFRKKVAIARKTLQECRSRQQKVNALLDRVEKENTSFAQRNYLHFEIFENYRRRQADIFPWPPAATGVEK